MVVAIFGESCVGKSTLAEELKRSTGAQVFSGKDYLRLAKSEPIARKLFEKKLQEAVSGENIVYVISEREHMALIPDGALRVLVTAELPVILERFARRMHGSLPESVRVMLEKKHGMFDTEAWDYHVTGDADASAVCRVIAEKIG